MHARRPSRGLSPETERRIAHGPSASTAPLRVISGELPQGPERVRRKSSGSFKGGVGTATARMGALAIRHLKSRRTLGFLVVGSIIWLFLAVFKPSATDKDAKTYSGILPLLRKSSDLIQRKAPPPIPPTKAEREALLSHTFHPNGLLIVNPTGKHPIHELIDRAQKRWKNKVARQSRTLKEAVNEYKRRYRRNPPKGFDDWWAFAEKNNVQLRDEYDQIDHDMAPHRSLEPGDSRHRNFVMQTRDHTFMLALNPGERVPKAYGQHAELERATDVSKLLSHFAGNLPRSINMTFIIDDNPAVMLPYSQRERMEELATQGEFYGPSEFIEAEDLDVSNFAQACASNSPLRRAERGETIPDFSPESGRSFIWDSGRAADLCEHPEIRKYHGHSMQQGVPIGPLVPLFTFAKTRLHADILVTPLEQYSESYIGYDPPWEQKSQNRLLWRGSTTGVEFDKHTPWKLSQRVRLHMQSQNMEGDKTLIWSQRGSTKESTFSVASLNKLYMDTAFAGGPVQCDEETCKIMRDTIKFQAMKGLDESNQYKYMMDVDGNGWSGRFHRLMSSRSLVLKSTVFPEWYQDRIEPWVHFVPVKVDYSDMYDTMAFFIGTPDGQGGHDSLAEKIATAGKDWAATHWRSVDMASYMYRLVLEYSRILAVGEESDIDYIDESAFNLDL